MKIQKYEQGVIFGTGFAVIVINGGEKNGNISMDLDV